MVRRAPARAPVQAADAVVPEHALRAVLNEGGASVPLWERAEWDLMCQSVAFFASEVLSGDPNPPYDGRFIVSKHHEEWDLLIQECKRLCVLASRDHGKCVVGSTRLLAADGSRIEAADWKGGDIIAWDQRRKAFARAYALPAVQNGVQPIVKIQTRTGRELSLTHNHPLLRWEGFTAAAELSVGDRVAVAYSYPDLGTEPIQNPWLVGALVGDGGLSGSNVCVTKADADFIGAVRADAVGRGWGLEPCSDGITYRLVSQGKGPRAASAQVWLRSLGLWGCTSRTKRVPGAVFTAPNDDVARFVCGYFDSDGGVNLHGGGAIEFSSVSKLLLEDVQHLLARLGVLAVLTLKNGKYKGEAHVSWRLTVRGKDILRFAECVDPRGKKRGQLAELVAVQKAKEVCSGKAVDSFPKQVYELVTHSDAWFQRNGLTRPSKQYSPTREKLERLAPYEPAIARLLQQPVFWDEVTSVEFLPPEMTWSICVPEHQTFVTGNDIVNHNTFFFDFAYPIHELVTKPKSKGYIFSASREQAARILDDIKGELESNPELQYLVPSSRDRRAWAAHRIKCTNGCEIRALGYRSRARGGHPDWIVVDDGLNDETAYSEIIRKKEKEYFFTAISNMITPTGRIVVVGTPFAADDLYGELRTNPEYEFVQYQAYNPKTGRALWPERYNLTALKAKRREIGPIRFAREFMCEPVTDDMSLFPTHLFRGDPVEQPMVKLRMPYAFWKNLGVTSVYMGVDVALSAEAGADYTVVFVVGVDKFGNRWIMDMVRRKGMPYDQQKAMFHTLGRYYRADLIFIEANQAQRIFGDELIRTTDLPIKRYNTGAEKHSLEKGVPALRIMLENRKYRIPRGDTFSIEQMEIWISEMRSFTFEDGKVISVGSHDDTVMALFLVEQAIREGGFSFEDDEIEADLAQGVQPMTYEEIYGLDTEEDHATFDETAAYPLGANPDDDDDDDDTSNMLIDEADEVRGAYWKPRGM